MPSVSPPEPMVVDAGQEPGEIPHRSSNPPNSGNHRRSGCRRGWANPPRRHGFANPTHHDDSNSDALNTFTRFFRAEAQAKELATRKEAHAFDLEVHAEHDCDRRREHSHHSHSCKNPNLTLDNRGHRHDRPLRIPSQTRPAPAVQSSPPSGPSTVAQVIAAASAASVPHPAPPAASSTSPTPDEGPDIADIISATEQMDIDNAAHFQAEFFGKVFVLVYLVTLVLTLAVTLAAWGSVPHTGPAVAPMPARLASPVPSA
ncbi:uncharacterized protein EDB91DRAFT_1083489 [Suillus paluster]|uniref:uncharacterized protein n=1 Tax=Suillus paluster TaxID=48578 RepID=UPI001B863FF0|nr:uncharacterized protein EDB91DRAFT_1083489 [Suillus paluster]KAG1736161.1 hypothetical protein EDB91DRAFT_1083489 [Suillus paluster]